MKIQSFNKEQLEGAARFIIGMHEMKHGLDCDYQLYPTVEDLGREYKVYLHWVESYTSHGDRADTYSESWKRLNFVIDKQSGVDMLRDDIDFAIEQISSNPVEQL